MVVVIQIRASNVKNKLPLSRSAVQRIRTQMLEPEPWDQISVLPVCVCVHVPVHKCVHMCAYICACVCVWLCVGKLLKLSVPQGLPPMKKE